MERLKGGEKMKVGQSMYIYSLEQPIDFFMGMPDISKYFEDVYNRKKEKKD